MIDHTDDETVMVRIRLDLPEEVEQITKDLESGNHTPHEKTYPALVGQTHTSRLYSGGGDLVNCDERGNEI